MSKTSPPPRKPIPATIYYLGLGALTLLLASLPYLYALGNTPPGHLYTGLTYNMDDALVYLSWMRQVEDGSLFQRNLFAVEPQKGALINVFSLLLGGISRFTPLGLVETYHLARVVFGGLLLWAMVALIRETLEEDRSRRLAFALVCLSSGLGWLLGGYAPERGFQQPVDLWQPEAITFLSLYYTPLFTAALALMAVFIRAALRWERDGGWSAPALAGVTTALLANFHTYDIVPLFGTWIGWRVVQDLRAKRLELRRWAGVALALTLTLPTVAYQYWALLQDPIFAARNVETLSAGPGWLLLGLGLLTPLALVSLLAGKRSAERFTGSDAVALLAVWALVAVLCAYLPVAFQRKLLMGVHLPLCLLGGASLALLTDGLSGGMRAVVAAAVVTLTLPSNAFFLLQDIGRLDSNASSTENRPFLRQGEAEALDWLRRNAPSGAVVFSSPDPESHRRFPYFPLRPYLSMLVPAWTGKTVYNGHGSETPDFGRKLAETLRFFRQGSSDQERLEFLRQRGITHILYATRLREGTPADPQGQPISDEQGPYLPVDWSGDAVPFWLQSEFQNADVTIYRVSP